MRNNLPAAMGDYEDENDEVYDRYMITGEGDEFFRVPVTPKDITVRRVLKSTLMT